MKICYQEVSSPIGPLFIVADNHFLKAITFGNNWNSAKEALGEMHHDNNTIIQQARIQLTEYFAKQRRTFTLPITIGGTFFQQQTWQALLTIPYGETRSYSEQANLIGKPKAVRAVGRTNGLNPIPIVIPCHRVIGKSGKLAGYAGGLDIKTFLLELEGNNVSHGSLAQAPH